MISKFGNIFLFLILFISIVSFSQEKRGLIIAISKYQDRNWKEIHSTNDISLIKNILISQGFKVSNIKVLQDSTATKRNINDAFEDLYNESNKGDIIVIHFSGHGQRIFDDNGDESDFADEALVPYDAFQEWSEFYKGENHLRDDEFGEYLIKLREKVGAEGSIVLFIDACYSGTIARNPDFYRGVDDIFAPPEYKNKIKNIISNPNQSTGIFKSSELYDEGVKNNLADLIIFSSSRNNERSKEVTDGKNFYGSLSYALSVAFSVIKGNETYREIYERVYSYMKFNARLMQVPLIEGSIDKIIFSNRMQQTFPYFKIIDKNLYGEFIVNGGRITGLFDSTIIGIYSEETTDPDISEPLTVGTIYNSDNFQSNIRIENFYKLKESDLGKYRLFILREGIILNKLNVSFEDISEQIKNSLLDELSKLTFIEINEENPDYIISNKNINNKESDSIYIYRVGNPLKLLSSFSSISLDISDEVKTKLKNLYLRDILLKFEMKSEYYDIDISINNLSKGTVSSSLIQDAFLFDTIKITIKNVGQRPGYITLINFQPDDSVKQYIPKRNESYSQYYIEPGGIIEKRFRNSKLGEDIYKIIITKDFIDFSYILDSKISKRAGDLTELEILFDEIKQGFTPRANLTKIGTTKQVLINVKSGN